MFDALRIISDKLKMKVIFFHTVIIKVKRYLGHREGQVWKTVSDVLKSLNGSPRESVFMEI